MTFTEAKNDILQFVEDGNTDNNLAWNINDGDLTEADRDELTKDWNQIGEGMYVKEYNQVEYMVKIYFA